MIEVEVEAEAWSTVEAVEAVAVRAAQAALGVAGIGGAAGTVVILLSDDDTVRDLNGRFRGKDRPTNVLSFPAIALAGLNPAPLGDIVLAYETCAAEAELQGKTLADHLSHLVVHGVLHLMGRDHEDDQEAETMEAEESVILASLGIADPYGAVP